MKVYPSKRVKNYAAKKLRRIFDIKGKVVLKHAPSIFHTGDKCFGLCYSDIEKGLPIHRIIMAEDANASMENYIATLLHEYVHAWQFENGYKPGHSKKNKFHQWAKYLNETQKGVVI
jgi:predicted metalloprotease with PDZ domain